MHNHGHYISTVLIQLNLINWTLSQESTCRLGKLLQILTDTLAKMSAIKVSSELAMSNYPFDTLKESFAIHIDAASLNFSARDPSLSFIGSLFKKIKRLTEI